LNKAANDVAAVA